MGHMRGMKLWILLWVLSAGAESAEASILTRGADCAPVMTIQKRGCVVETQYLCGKGDAATWRSENFEAAGVDGVSVSTLAYDPIEFADGSGDGGIVFDAGRTFSSHPNKVIAEGVGQLEQGGMFIMRGLSRPVTVQGTLKRLDPPLVLDGVTLQRIELSGTMQFPQPMKPLTLVANYHYDARTRVLFAGESKIELPWTKEKPLESPARIILPGQPGFQSEQPVFDCGELSMAAPLAPNEG